MAAVLVDGSPSSLRALELATIPNLFLRHDDQQLLLLHGWCEGKDAPQGTAIPAALDVIAKSRVAQYSLNYKIEMVKTPAPPGASSADPAAAGNASPLPGDGGKAATAAEKGAGKKKNSQAPFLPTPGEGGAAATASATLAAETRAVAEAIGNKLATYASERLEHHQAVSLLLGVGNTQQGKMVTIGNVAKAVLATLRDDVHRLFFVKASGPPVRVNAPLRVLVVVLSGGSLDHLRAALQCVHPASRGDRVGVVLVVNNGLGKADADAVDPNGPAAATANECLALLAEQQALAQEGGGAAGGGAPEEGGMSVAPDTFPVVQPFALEPTNHFKTPTIDDVPAQLVKFVGSVKTDFVVLPRPFTSSDTDAPPVASEGFVNAFLSAPKPHVLLV